MTTAAQPTHAVSFDPHTMMAAKGAPNPSADRETRIHPRACVDPDAVIGLGTVVGPYAVVGPRVVLSEGVTVGPHAIIEGLVEVGPEALIGAHVCIGQIPQDRKYRGEDTGVRIGARTQIREFATINRATGDGTRWTEVGDDALLMAYSHIAHDCQVGPHATLANGVMLAGHVQIEPHVTLGGRALVQQFARIGRWAFVAATAAVERDVPPFCRVAGDRARLAGLNLVGLQRAGLEPDEIKALKRAYKALFRTNDPVSRTTEVLRQTLGEHPCVLELIDAIQSSKRGICR